MPSDAYYLNPRALCICCNYAYLNEERNVTFFDTLKIISHVLYIDTDTYARARAHTRTLSCNAACVYSRARVGEFAINTNNVKYSYIATSWKL